MAAEYFFREFKATQQEILDRAIQAYEGYLRALKSGRPLKGGMHWKKIKGKDYLYKYRDRYGNGESLGPRSPETERLFKDFDRQRRELAERLAARREDLATAARFCRAALIHRVPETVMRIVRRLEMSGLKEVAVTVIGTHALHAYEFAAGVFIDVPKGSRFWSGAAQKLTLAAARPIPPDDLLRLLRQADRSFQPLPGNGFGAVNKAGFLVKLARPSVVRTQTRAASHDVPGPAVPAESGDLSALLGAPKFSQVVIGKRGAPFTLSVPDPRSLALHKLWLSQQEDREPERRSRDRTQAMALAELILRYLPQYYFFSSQLNLFPPEVVRPAQGLVEGYELSPELDMD
jgi:hypothetical protein